MVQQSLGKVDQVTEPLLVRRLIATALLTLENISLLQPLPGRVCGVERTVLQDASNKAGGSIQKPNMPTLSCHLLPLPDPQICP